MKKLSIVAVLLIMCVSLAACSSSEDGQTTPEQSKSSSAESIQLFDETESNKTEKVISYAEMIPPVEDIFKNGEIRILDSDGGDMYALHVTNFTDEEYNEYVDKCKEYGFNDISYDIKDDRFGAYTADGDYWVQVSKDEEGTISIVCNKSKQK